MDFCVFFFFQAEDGIRDLVRSRGLGDVYKRQDPVLKRKNLDLALRYIDRSLFIFPNYGQGLNMKAGILAEFHKMDKNLDLFLENIKEVILKRPDLAFIQEYFRFLMKDNANRMVLSLFCRDIGYQTFFKAQRRYDMGCLLYTSPSPRDRTRSRMPSSA